MKVVIDTNILVMIITSRSPYHQIYQDLVNGKYGLLVNTEVLLEYQEVIEIKYGKTTSDFFLQLLDELPNVLFISTYYQWQMIEKDKDDNKYVDCAIAGQADFIVTEDRHFDILAQIDFPKVKVINLETFYKLLQNS